MDLREIKDFLRIDFDEDDDYILSLKSAAESYLKNAGIVVSYSNSLYILAIKLLVSHWYENREVIGNDKKMAYSLCNIITQLKYCHENVNS